MKLKIILNEIKLKKTKHISEVAYDGNLGFHEMFVFYSKATDSQVDKLEDLIKKKRFKEAWRFVQKVTGMALKGAAFESTMIEAIANTHLLDIDEVLKSYQRGIKQESNGGKVNETIRRNVLKTLSKTPNKY
jgi:hypothetical protein